MEDLKWTHDKKNNKYHWNYNCNIWGKEVDVKIVYSNKLGIVSKNELINCEIASMEMITRVQKRKYNVISFISKTGIFDLAESWLKNNDKIVKDKVHYFRNDKEELIPVDLTQEEFIKYIFFHDLEIRQTDDKVIADIFLITNPDCFSEHMIEIFLLKDIALDKYRISFNGIVTE